MSHQAFDPTTKRLEDAALGFKEHSTMEALRKMTPAERDEHLRRMGPSTRISYGHYLVGRDAARKLGKIA